MGIFDNNVHMNGAGTTYQAFSFQADELSVTISSLSELGQKKKRMKPFSR